MPVHGRMHHSISHRPISKAPNDHIYRYDLKENTAISLKNPQITHLPCHVCVYKNLGRLRVKPSSGFATFHLIPEWGNVINQNHFTASWHSPHLLAPICCLHTAVVLWQTIPWIKILELRLDSYLLNTSQTVGDQQHTSAASPGLFGAGKVWIHTWLL